MRIKNLFKNPLFYLNVALILLLSVVVTAPRIGGGRLPTLIKQVFAAVGPMQGDGTVGRIARAVGANQIGDSVIHDNGTNIGIGGVPQTSYQAFVHGGLGINGQLDVGQGASGSGSLNVDRTGSNLAALGASHNGSWRLIIVPRLGAGGFNSIAADNDVGIINNGGNLVLGGWNSGAGIRVTSGGLEVKGNILHTGSIAQGSDIRLKENIQPITGALEQLLNLQGKEFEWKEPEKHGNLTGIQRGFIAQDVENVFPDWVGTDADGYKTLSVRGLEALTVEALRELKAENESLKARIQTLEDGINADR